MGYTYVYTYDNAGNITERKTYNVTSATAPTNPIAIDTYGYGDSVWGDRMMSYRGRSITYDAIGNPITYYNGMNYNFTWEGRRLVGATQVGTSTYNIYSFTYNADGIRTSKTVNGIEHKYYLDGTTIVAEEWGNNLLMYMYDPSGSPLGMMYRTTSYASGTFDIFWFEKNLQGDIVAVYNNAGEMLITYKYNAWGIPSMQYHNYSSTSPARYNPFRYRGYYYYDSDLEMYYLQSRYYDPKIERFISLDDIEVITATPMGLTDKNPYAYCDNNPVMRVDGDGEFWGAILIGVAVGLAAQYISDIVCNIASGETGADIFKPSSSAVDYVAAGVAGGIAAIPTVGLAGTLITGAAGNIASEVIKGNVSSAQDVFESGFTGAIANGLGYGVSRGFAKLKTNQILSMNRASKKSYLTEKIYKNSRSYANANLHTFMDNPLGVVENSFSVFKYGIYSTIYSTMSLSAYGGFVRR